MFWRALTNYIASNSWWEYMSYWTLTNTGYCYFKNPCQCWIAKSSISLIFYFSFICFILGLNFSPFVYVLFAFCFLWCTWQYFSFFLLVIIFGFPMWLYHFAFPTKKCECSNLHPCWCLIFSLKNIYIERHSKRHILVLHCGLVCISLMTNDVQ